MITNVQLLTAGMIYIGEACKDPGGVVQGTHERAFLNPWALATNRTSYYYMHNFNILGRECQDLTRLIEEAIFIRVNNPTLNRNIGKFQLSHIWDRVLFSTPNLKAAFPQGNVQHSP